jgi:shikimate dehydrogenase
LDQYGLVGHPVSHSLSPFIHAMFARETGQNMTYRLYDVPAEDLDTHVRGFFEQGGLGLNITVPHKIAAVELAAALTERAAHAAAINTLGRAGDGVIFGDNTDGAGLVRDLCENLGLGLAGARVLVLGAGGATRGVLAPLLGLGPATVTVANRTPERAAALAAAFADLGTIQGSSFEEVGDEPFDLIINATSASLSGEIPPIPQQAVGGHTVCYDMSYGRAASAFVEWAEQRGCALAVQGLGMLVEQAAESFEIWRGMRPDTSMVLAALKARAARL